jgi:hypothetical protein
LTSIDTRMKVCIHFGQRGVCIVCLKGERKFLGDELIKSGELEAMTNDDEREELSRGATV